MKVLLRQKSVTHYNIFLQLCSASEAMEVVAFLALLSDGFDARHIWASHMYTHTYIGCVLYLDRQIYTKDWISKLFYWGKKHEV